MSFYDLSFLLASTEDPIEIRSRAFEAKLKSANQNTVICTDLAGGSGAEFIEDTVIAPPASLMLFFSISAFAVSRRSHRQCRTVEFDRGACRSVTGTQDERKLPATGYYHACAPSSATVLCPS